MNNWLNDELQGLRQAKDEQRQRDARQELIGHHTAHLWENLRWAINDAADKINGNSQLSKIVGPLSCEVGYTDRVEIAKQAYPAVYLTVSCGPRSIVLHRKIVINQTHPRRREERESLDVHLDSEGFPLLQAKNGAFLTADEAVQYIFTPILHSATLY